MKKVISVFVLVMILGSINNLAGSNCGSVLPEDPWKLYLDNNNIQIYYKTIQCTLPDEGIRKEMVVLKFINKTESQLFLEWDMQLFYNENCRTCDVGGDAYHYKLTLKPRSVTEGNCNSEKELLLFSKFIIDKEMMGLTKFELANLSIK